MALALRFFERGARSIGSCVIAPEVIAEELSQGKLYLLDVGNHLPDISFFACWMESPDNYTVRTVAKLAQEIAMQAAAAKP